VVGFLGCGTLSRALIVGALEKKIFKPSQILISTRTLNSRRQFCSETGVNSAANNGELIRNSEIIFLGVKPSEMVSILRQLSEEHLEEKIIISLAAGVGERMLMKNLKSARGVFRVMANLGATIQAGVFGVFSIKANPSDEKKIKGFFSKLGEIVVVRNDQGIDTITAGSASGVGFVLSFMEDFQGWLEKRGLSRDVARRVTIETFLGAAKLAQFRSDLSFSTLKKSVSSKKGTTQAGLDIFKKEKISASLKSGLDEAFKRAQEISKDLLRQGK